MDTELDSLKSASIRVVHKTGDFLGNKIADAVTKSNDDNIVRQQQSVERNNYSTRKKRLNIRKNKKSIIQMERYIISKLLNNSTVSKFLTKNWVEVNDLPSGQYSVNKGISFKTSMLRSAFCDFSDTYVCKRKSKC